MTSRARTRIQAVALLGAAAFALTMPTQAPSQALTVSGYADLFAYVDKLGSGNKEFYFDNYHVNLIMIGKITGDLFAAVELEYEHGGEETALEYGYFGYTGFKDVRIMAGKFIVPFGRFNKDIHPTPINKVPDRPLGFGDVLPQTYNDVGLWISGAKAMNDDARFVFDVFMVNGLLGKDGGSIRSMRDNDREIADYGRDDDKALGGRLGFELPYQGFDIGASAYRGRYARTKDLEDLGLVLLGLDASYQKNGFALRGEVVRASQDASAGDLTKTGGYVQASYWLTERVEPVIRYSTQEFPSDKDDLGRMVLGLNFQVSPASIVRLAYLLNSEKAAFKKDNNALVAQFNVLF
mgnify:CR=1 FL=1